MFIDTHTRTDSVIHQLFRIPNAAGGDKIFLYDDEDAPTDIPSDALEIKRIFDVGDSYRRVFICQLAGS